MSARMQNLVRIRALQEKIARGEVARAQAEHDVAVAAQQHVWNALASTSDQLYTMSTGAAMHLAQQHLSSGIALAHMRGAVADAAGARVQGNLRAWTGTAQRLEAVERLAERVEERTAHTALQTASNEMDDNTIARHLMKRAS